MVAVKDKSGRTLQSESYNLEGYLERDPVIHGIPSLVLKEYSPVCLKMS